MILFIFMHIKAVGNGGSPSVTVPVVLKQFNNAIKLLICSPYYYSYDRTCSLLQTTSCNSLKMQQLFKA